MESSGRSVTPVSWLKVEMELEGRNADISREQLSLFKDEVEDAGTKKLCHDIVVSTASDQHIFEPSMPIRPTAPRAVVYGGDL